MEGEWKANAFLVESARAGATRFTGVGFYEERAVAPVQM
jgi:hypothetical protein